LLAIEYCLKRSTKIKDVCYIKKEATQGCKLMWLFFDRLAPRKPRPLGRGQGELYKNACLPYREAPPFKAGASQISVKNQAPQRGA